MLNNNFYQINPFNQKHIKLLEEFEKENEIKTKINDSLKKITISMTEKEYNNSKIISNEIEENLFIKENNKMKDTCHIIGEKDIKTCNITFAQVKTKFHNRKLISLATDYAINILGMLEVFIHIKSDDKNMFSNLEDKGFENLGEENGEIIFLKEKELN